jgi:hypothetical protein
MKIYFAGSIRGGRHDTKLYRQIIQLLTQYGEVLTEHVGSDELPPAGEANMCDEDIYKRDVAWLSDADVVIAEVSTPSHGVGYEIATAEWLNKPTLCIYHPVAGRRASAMLTGNTKLWCTSYENVQDLEPILERFLSPFL